VSRERWLRRGDEAAPFDRRRCGWASEFGVPADLAHALYFRATRQARDTADARALLPALLREDTN